MKYTHKMSAESGKYTLLFIQHIHQSNNYKFPDLMIRACFHIYKEMLVCLFSLNQGPIDIEVVWFIHLLIITDVAELRFL